MGTNMAHLLREGGGMTLCIRMVINYITEEMVCFDHEVRLGHNLSLARVRKTHKMSGCM